MSHPPQNKSSQLQDDASRMVASLTTRTSRLPDERVLASAETAPDTLGSWTRDQYVSAALWLMENNKLPDPQYLATLTPMLALLEFKVSFKRESGNDTPPELPDVLPIHATPAKRWVNQAFKAAFESLFHVKPVVK